MLLFLIFLFLSDVEPSECQNAVKSDTYYHILLLATCQFAKTENRYQTS